MKIIDQYTLLAPLMADENNSQNIYMMASVFLKRFSKGDFIILLNDSTFSPNKRIGKVKTNSKKFDIINGWVSKQIDGGRLRTIKKGDNWVSFFDVADNIHFIKSKDPRTLVFWLRNPNITYELNIGKKFKFKFKNLNEFEVKFQKLTPKLITNILAISPNNVHGEIKGLGQKGFESLLKQPLYWNGNKALSSMGNFSERLKWANELLKKSFQRN